MSVQHFNVRIGGMEHLRGGRESAERRECGNA